MEKQIWKLEELKEPREPHHIAILNQTIKEVRETMGAIEAKYPWMNLMMYFLGVGAPPPTHDEVQLTPENREYFQERWTPEEVEKEEAIRQSYPQPEEMERILTELEEPLLLLDAHAWKAEAMAMKYVRETPARRKSDAEFLTMTAEDHLALAEELAREDAELEPETEDDSWEDSEIDSEPEPEDESD
jgi:hypothetical protein